MDHESYLELLHLGKEEYTNCCNNLEAQFQETFNWLENSLSNIKKYLDGESTKNVITSKSRKRCMNLVIKEEEVENDDSEKNCTTSTKRQLSTESDSSEKQTNSSPQRSRRNASKKARAAINDQIKSNLNTKLRRPDNYGNFESVYVKLEKIDKENICTSTEKKLNNLSNTSVNDKNDQSQVGNVLSCKENLNSNVNILEKKIKKEKLEDFLMPPPQATKVRSFKKTIKRSSKLNNKKVSTLSSQSDDENDIIEINDAQKISIIHIDSDDEHDNESIENNTDQPNVPQNNKNRRESGVNETNKDIENEDKSTYESLEKTNKEETMYEDTVQGTNEQTQFVIKDCCVALNELTLPDNEENHRIDKTQSYKSDLFDVTVTLEKAHLLNETYCKEISSIPEKTNKQKTQLPVTSLQKKYSSIVTDDDSSSECKTPEQLKIIKKSKLKQPSLFSPYTNDPVKKRVEAFEKLEKDNTSSSTKETVRITRTKTRALAAANAAKEKVSESDSKENQKNTTNLLKTIERNTPLNVKRIAPITAQFSNKPLSKSTPLTKSTESLKSVSSVKLKSNEKKEELRKEKEDVLRKKEALLHARIEEQRKKREEKAFKAQQARENLEKERQFAIMQAEREKEEKQKQLQSDREEMLRKEAQRKRALAAQRAAETEERRKAEEAARLAKLQEQDEAERRAELQRKKDLEEADRLHQKRVAEEREAKLIRDQARAQMKANMKAKLLNKVKTDATPSAKVPYPKVPVTVDMFDSGDSTDDESNPKRPIPSWSKSSNRLKPVKSQFYIPSNIVSEFFSCKPTVINLTEIFDQLDSRHLRRNSSAVWFTPPRYSQMPKY